MADAPSLGQQLCGGVGGDLNPQAVEGHPAAPDAAEELHQSDLVSPGCTNLAKVGQRRGDG
eukprot:329766-Pyramimonas_sp.AAC.2